MKERPTPEAGPDNNEQRELAAWLKLKRKAVRERNEAREEVAHWKTEYEIVVARLCGKKHPRDNGIFSEHEIIPKLERERDEARANAKYWQEQYGHYNPEHEWEDLPWEAAK